MYDIATRYRESEEADAGSAGPQRKIHNVENTVRTPELLHQIQNRIFEDGGSSVRQLAAIFGVNLRHKILRLEEGPMFSRKMEHPPFSVELTFHQHEYVLVQGHLAAK